MSNLESLFHKDILNIYKKADEELGYRATRFLQMLAEHGGVETAKKLVTKPGGTEGFIVLWEHKKLDLSVENLVLKEEYRSLFSEEIRQICRDRLKEYGFER
ncbi:MAG: hypothetical protein N2645_10655 [Clostridia bacterium]|nr:hypothetical protein [Clostridia bacterium]